MLHRAVTLPSGPHMNSEVEFCRPAAHIRRLIFRSPYPALSIPAFVGLSVLVTIALALTIVALAVALVLHLAWRATSLLFQGARRSHGKQPAPV
jgi:hypothetical protein